MYEYKKAMFVVALLSTVSPWVLKSTHRNIVPQLTDDVTLSCHCENHENVQCKMDQLMRIRLLKRNITGNWMTFAEIFVPNNSRINLDHPFSSNIVASGHLGTSNESFLSVTWPTADDDTVGSYQCEVDGFGEDSRSDVHLSTQTVNITGFLTTTTDLVNIMIKMKYDFHSLESIVEKSLLEVRYWPEGNYTLLSPASGCPDTPYAKMVPGFAKITTETKHKPNNLLSSPNHLHPDVVERCGNRNVIHLRLCRNPIPDSQVVLWPEGSYCIHSYKWPDCPSGFTRGFVRSFLESSSTIVLTQEKVGSMRHGSGFIDISFCCRRDGDPNLPVLLPNNKPFYLYRYRMKCQKVRNMDVSDEWIQLDSTRKDIYSGLTPNGKLNDVTINICYYTKRK